MGQSVWAACFYNTDFHLYQLQGPRGTYWLLSEGRLSTNRHKHIDGWLLNVHSLFSNESEQQQGSMHHDLFTKGSFPKKDLQKYKLNHYLIINALFGILETPGRL